MKRKRALAVGLILTVMAILLLVYAAKKVTYLYSFDRTSRSANVAANEKPRSRGPSDAVTLSWELVPGASTYNLYWSTRPGVTRTTGKKVSGIKPPYRFTRIERGRTYFFVVTAVSGGVESSESEEIIYRADP